MEILQENSIIGGETIVNLEDLERFIRSFTLASILDNILKFELLFQHH